MITISSGTFSNGAIQTSIQEVYKEYLDDDASTNIRLSYEWVAPSDITKKIFMDNTEIQLKRLDYNLLIKKGLSLFSIEADDSITYIIKIPESNTTVYPGISIIGLRRYNDKWVYLAFGFYMTSIATAVSLVINGIINIKPMSPFFIIGSLFFLATLSIPLLENI